MKYPEDSIQYALGTDWWLPSDNKIIKRGMLLWCFVPHFDQTPYMFEPVGRSDPEKHDSAEVNVTPLRVNAPLTQVNLPVAAMPLYRGEVWAAYRAKKRPCVVLGSGSQSVERQLTRGTPKSHTAPTLIVAPYFGADQNGVRAGYTEAFIERVRHCEYPQFFWDMLPVNGANESILRLDQIQPIGAHHSSYDITGYELSPDALSVLDEMYQWLIHGGVEDDSCIAIYRSEIESVFK